MTYNDYDLDPFRVEARRHGDNRLGVLTAREHGAMRDRIRYRTDCPRCVELTEQMDAALMSAMLDGTGPWG